MANSTAAKLSCSPFGCSYSPQLVVHGNGSPCCESSSHQIQDGLPGHSVCHCQLDRVLQHRVASMPVNVLPRPPFGDTGYNIGSGAGLSAFYSPLARACEIKDVPQPWRDSWFLSHASRGPFELHGFDPHTHGACTRFAERFSPIDLAAAGARRKNATRETTSTLKAWLYEHRKNPYPTKGEKIMLAILTKMTLTQVSTWFANARRRLKKENKMTWSPRNRCGERKEDEGDASDLEDIDLDVNSDDEKTDLKHEDIEDKEYETKEIKKEPTEIHQKTTESEGCSLPDGPECPTDRKDDLIQEKPDEPSPTHPRSPQANTKNDPKVSSSTVDYSPVKSLRKWVDGCFVRNSVVTSCPSSVQTSCPVNCTIPTATLPERLSAETPVITSALSSKVHHPRRRLSSEDERSSTNSSPCQEERERLSRPKREELPRYTVIYKPTEDRSPEQANYREFDAALALTTLSSR